MRIAAAAPLPFDALPGTSLNLRDGSTATVRAAGPGDCPAVGTFFRELSLQSRERRFSTAANPPDDAIARLCAAIDVTRSVTLLAMGSIDGQERLLGVASYFRVTDAVAEVAVAVDDHFGHLGIATGLLKRQAALADDGGFERFHATTQPENEPMLQVFRDSGFTVRSKSDCGGVDVELSLTAPRHRVAACEGRDHTAAFASIPPVLTTDAEWARALCREIVEVRGEDWLTAEELRRVLNAFGFPVVHGVLSHKPDEAAALAAVMGLPVVAKLGSHRIVHKSDVDGVRVNLATEEAVRKAFDDLMNSARASDLIDQVDGVLIQPMIVEGTEMMVGLFEDPLFGPLVAVGLGGVQEELGEFRFRIAPVTDRDADEVLHEMRGLAPLDGHRGRPRADIEALAGVVLLVSRLAEEMPEILELDLNPVIVLVAGQGCRIVDARVKVGRRMRARSTGGL